MKKDQYNEIGELLCLQDAKIEPLLVELMEQGILRKSNFVISNKGLFTRSYLKEVKDFREKEWNNVPYLEIEINREGLYDMLPKMVFHKQEQASAYDTIDRYIAESRHEKEQEAEARLFFAPIEQEFFRNRLQIEKEERALNQGFENPLQQILFSRYWSDTKGVEEDYKDILLYLLPLSHQIAGNDKALEGCISTLLGEEVQMLRVPSHPHDFSDEIAIPLGEAKLGIDWVLGQSVASETETLVISIGPIALKSVSDYLPKGPKARLLNVICESFVPFELDYVFHITLEERATGFRLIDKEETTARLGYSTVL